MGLVLFALLMAVGPGAVSPAGASPPAVIAQPSSPLDPSFVGSPDWVAKPTGEDMAAAYPRSSLAAGLSGRATTLCRVAPDGRLRDCEIAVEEPAGGGFGAAALTLMPLFQMKTVGVDGVPVEGRKIRMPLRWKLPPNS